MEARALIAQLLKYMNGQIHGRVALQKLLYFCKVCGADVDASYRLYIYGPYSQQVADALQDGIIDHIFAEHNGLIGEGEEFQEYYREISSSWAPDDDQEQIVKDVVDTFKAETAKQLEIIATTFFIDCQQKALFSQDDKNIVLDKVRRAKSARFSEQEIQESYGIMMEKCVPLVKKHMVR